MLPIRLLPLRIPAADIAVLTQDDVAVHTQDDVAVLTQVDGTAVDTQDDGTDDGTEDMQDMPHGTEDMQGGAERVSRRRGEGSTNAMPAKIERVPTKRPMPSIHRLSLEKFWWREQPDYGEGLGLAQTLSGRSRQRVRACGC
jgi:hypothetical protein